MACLQQVAYHGVLRAQVEDVVLVDRRRDDEKGRPELGLAQRAILDQLEDVVFEYHVSRRDGQIDAYLEGAGVALAQLAFAQIVEQVEGAGEQAGAAGFRQLLQGIGVARQEVAWRTGGNGLFDQVVQPFAWLFHVNGQQRHQLEHVAGVEQVESGQRAEYRFMPVAAGEAPVAEIERLLGE